MPSIFILLIRPKRFKRYFLRSDQRFQRTHFATTSSFQSIFTEHSFHHDVEPTGFNHGFHVQIKKRKFVRRNSEFNDFRFRRVPARSA